MTATTATAPDREEPDKEKPDKEEPAGKGPESPRPDDPFDHDVLPTPPGATAALLRSLLAPMKARVAVTTLLLLLQQAAVQAGPLLVAYAIDTAVPAFRRDDLGPLVAVGAGYLLCAVASGVLQYAFILLSARVNQDVLLDLRGRIFRHAQALSLDFHERYTSGRLISRSTTDVESLRSCSTKACRSSSPSSSPSSTSRRCCSGSTSASVRSPWPPSRRCTSSYGATGGAPRACTPCGPPRSPP